MNRHFARKIWMLFGQSAVRLAGNAARHGLYTAKQNQSEDAVSRTLMENVEIHTSFPTDCRPMPFRTMALAQTAAGTIWPTDRVACRTLVPSRRPRRSERRHWNAERQTGRRHQYQDQQQNQRQRLRRGWPATKKRPCRGPTWANLATEATGWTRRRWADSGAGCRRDSSSGQSGFPCRCWRCWHRYCWTRDPQAETPRIANSTGSH